MDKIVRARMIIDRVLNLDERFGRNGPPRSKESELPTRMISDDPRWEARLTRRYVKNPSGDPWDLLELFVYGQARMTAAIRGEEVNLRFYIPGKWEPIFTIVDPFDTVPLKPS